MSCLGSVRKYEISCKCDCGCAFCNISDCRGIVFARCSDHVCVYARKKAGSRTGGKSLGLPVQAEQLVSQTFFPYLLYMYDAFSHDIVSECMGKSTGKCAWNLGIAPWWKNLYGELRKSDIVYAIYHVAFLGTGRKRSYKRQKSAGGFTEQL